MTRKTFFRGSLFVGSLAAVASTLVMLSTKSARAATLQSVAQGTWQQAVTGLPSYVNMHVYVPDAVADTPPIVVAPHHCQGTGPGTYSEMSSLVGIANDVGFILIFPEATGQNCWDAGSNRSLNHDGKGDTAAIVQMVRYALDAYGGDASRVYAVGASSGGIMTEALLGVYPDVFFAGVSLMGVPCGCWAEGYNDVIGTGNGAQWSTCASGTVNKTGVEWGDLVRSYYPGFAGHRPRLQHWHGKNDTTIDYKNHAEDIEAWTNVLGLDTAPTGTDTPSSGVTRQYWDSDCGFTVYEAFAMDNVAHDVPFDGAAVAAYFGLSAAGDPDPEVAVCGAPPGGPGGTGGGDGGGGTGAGASGSGGNDGGESPGGPLGTGGGAADPGGVTSGSGGASPDGGDSGGGCSCHTAGGREPASGSRLAAVLGVLSLVAARARRRP